jgi:hypothetical protein
VQVDLGGGGATWVGVVTRDAAASLHGHVLVPVHVDVEVDNVINAGERTGDVAEFAARARALAGLPVL